ncbi:4-alpha-glucanotransferase [Corynebacterium ciconiae]|uniref:4-alpha-glucanotransferase n=1 Tax=Corynebacterium ciconiae TaxID=227319 RepID=UPI000476FA47|nr:4-alpha-glucanotransferase [Corynebacterium ciconiae]
MSCRDELRNLASTLSVATQYTANDGTVVNVSDETLISIIGALGYELSADSSEKELAQLRARVEDAEATRPLPRCVVAREGDRHFFNVHVHDSAPADVRIMLEEGGEVRPRQEDNWTPPRSVDGQSWGEATFSTPADLPLGWHTLQLRSDGIDTQCHLVVTPASLSTTASLREQHRSGVMAQLYSVRSAESWGIGDFHDLGSLAEVLATHADADYVLVNPLHAAEPFPPVEDSPYLPTTRRFMNPIYLHIESIEEYQCLDEQTQAEIQQLAAPLKQLNHSGGLIDRNPIYATKLQVLRELYNTPRSAERERQFREYVEMEGQGLVDFSLWCAQQDIAADSDHTAEQGNHAAHEDPTEVAGFYAWLQWLCDCQLREAHRRALAAGMSIGIMADLAVGVHPGGADAHNLAEVLAPRASVGAPPDAYNQQGQDWSQPPWDPFKLAESGYAAWRDMLRTILRHSGGIRIDHILGLFRLWWIPRMQPPTEGTYVHFDYNALVGILALEAERAGAVVIGEDLGTFESWVQDVLAERGIMGTSILWFESEADGRGPRLPQHYRELCLTSVTTHDLPPTAGYLAGTHVRLRDELGLFSRSMEEENAEDLAWQNEVLERVRELGYFEGHSPIGDFRGAERGERGPLVELVAALHRYVAATPSLLTCTSLVDLVGDVAVQNQPGTTKEQYPNWCVPLKNAAGEPVLIEDLAEAEFFQTVAAAAAR